MIAVSGIIPRLRGIIDPVIYSKDTLTQDGTSYIITLTNKPVEYNSDVVYLVDTTFTTGYPQLVPRNGTQSAAYASVNNFVYTMDYVRGELSFYQGTGYVIGSGLDRFAPWAESNVIVYYNTSKYTDNALVQYLTDAVAKVEMSLQLGMYVSGVNGVPSNPRDYADNIDYHTDHGSLPNSVSYAPDDKFVIAEDLEIIQELIAKAAALSLMTRERRLGAGNAIKIVDGDITIDTSVNQRYLRDFVNDFAKEYDNEVHWVMYNMIEGYTLRQINEMAFTSIGAGNKNKPWDTVMKVSHGVWY